MATKKDISRYMRKGVISLAVSSLFSAGGLFIGYKAGRLFKSSPEAQQQV